MTDDRTAVTVPDDSTTLDDPTGAIASAGPSVPAGPERDPFALIHPEPGEAVPWPPGPDQRGLNSPYPPGGEDPAPEQAQHEERHYLWLLLAMVLAIVAGGFAISLLALALGYGGAA